MIQLSIDQIIVKILIYKQMKRAKLIISVLIISLGLSFMSCDEEIDKSCTHTDASGGVVGIYTGTISFDSESYSDVTIVLATSDTLEQAVALNIQSVSFNNDGGMDLDGVVNVAAANDEFVMSSGSSETAKLTGRLSDSNLIMSLPIQITKSGKARFYATGDVWSFVGTKQ